MFLVNYPTNYMYPAKCLDDRFKSFTHLFFTFIQPNFLMTFLRMVGRGAKLHWQNGWGDLGRI